MFAFFPQDYYIYLEVSYQLGVRYFFPLELYIFIPKQ